jgi:hypothetical protein
MPTCKFPRQAVIEYETRVNRTIEKGISSDIFLSLHVRSGCRKLGRDVALTELRKLTRTADDTNPADDRP